MSRESRAGREKKWRRDSKGGSTRRDEVRVERGLQADERRTRRGEERKVTRETEESRERERERERERAGDTHTPRCDGVAPAARGSARRHHRHVLDALPEELRNYTANFTCRRKRKNKPQKSNKHMQNIVLPLILSLISVLVLFLSLTDSFSLSLSLALCFCLVLLTQTPHTLRMSSLSHSLSVGVADSPPWR